MSNEDLSNRLGIADGDFYITAPSPCPYLPGREERKVFSYLNGNSAPSVNSMLTRRGFRRSQNIIYLPACERCSACSPVRIVVDDFKLTKSRRRTLTRNADLLRRLRPPRATGAQFSVLRAYIDARHGDGGMANMTVLDYAAMVEETAVDTMVIEYSRDLDQGKEALGKEALGGESFGGEELIACALTDRLSDGLSMVYSFFEPDYAARSLGAFMILDHIALAKDLGVPYIYLGYWVPGSPKMAYKKNYYPLERLTQGGWVRMDKETG